MEQDSDTSQRCYDVKSVQSWLEWSLITLRLTTSTVVTLSVLLLFYTYIIFRLCHSAFNFVDQQFILWIKGLTFKSCTFYRCSQWVWSDFRPFLSPHAESVWDNGSLSFLRSIFSSNVCLTTFTTIRHTAIHRAIQFNIPYNYCSPLRLYIWVFS